LKIDSLGEPITEKLVFRRTFDKRFRGKTCLTNIPHLIMVHSPDGFEWGYAGSGPSELALNALEAILLEFNYEGERFERDGKEAYMLTWEAYREFRYAFIEGIPNEGGIIETKDVIEWLKDAYQVEIGDSNDVSGG
jgi:hypothetical protein